MKGCKIRKQAEWTRTWTFSGCWKPHPNHFHSATFLGQIFRAPRFIGVFAALPLPFFEPIYRFPMVGSSRLQDDHYSIALGRSLETVENQHQTSIIPGISIGQVSQFDTSSSFASSAVNCPSTESLDSDPFHIVERDVTSGPDAFWSPAWAFRLRGAAKSAQEHSSCFGPLPRCAPGRPAR